MPTSRLSFSKWLAVALIATAVGGLRTASARSGELAASSEVRLLKPSDDQRDDEFGVAVAIAGSTVVVGAPLHQVGANAQQGLAYVFAGDSRGTAESARLIASDGGPSDAIGIAVAASGDAIVVGAPFEDVDGRADQGAVYVFLKPRRGWHGGIAESAKLVASDGAAFDAFGFSVAISDRTIVVGAASPDQGAAYVFQKPASGWHGTLKETSRLSASDGETGDRFGDSVGVSGDTVVVGAMLDDVEAGLAQGSAYVFVEPAGGWPGALSESAKLVASDGFDFDQLGGSIAISGHTVVVGALLDDVGSKLDQGSAYVFLRPPEGWQGTLHEAAKLVASDGRHSDLFGVSVGVAQSTIAVGSYLDDIGPNGGQGSVYVFDQPSEGWSGVASETVKLTAPDGVGADQLGMSVGIAARTIVTSTVASDFNIHRKRGIAYLFNLGDP